MKNTRSYPKHYGPLIVFSWGWDLRLPFGYRITHSRPDGVHTYVSRDGTPHTAVFHLRK
jgi:hypothetical protein